jgi:GntR family transcriptional regulator
MDNIDSRYGQERPGNMKIIISNASPDPIYEQITKQIKSQIINGELEEGQILPSIRKLAKELQISVITTKRAYEDLEHEGFIDTVTGKGSFVATQNKEFLREKRMKIVEDKLTEAIAEARLLGIGSDELREMLVLLYEEEVFDSSRESRERPGTNINEKIEE